MASLERQFYRPLQRRTDGRTKQRAGNSGKDTRNFNRFFIAQSHTSVRRAFFTARRLDAATSGDKSAPKLRVLQKTVEACNSA